MTPVKTPYIDSLRSSLTSFWADQLQIEASKDGLHIALPLMDASGWQIVVRLQQLTKSTWCLSDDGATLGALLETGRKPSKWDAEVDAQCRFYKIERRGLLLQRTIAFPFDAVDIQVFAEGMASISHLLPRKQADVSTKTRPRMEDRAISYFHRHQWTPQRRHKLAGKVEQEIVVDFYVEAERPIALQPVNRTDKLRSYMEQWGWRWLDLHNAHPDLVKAMIFDPDNQSWDAASRKIGETVCDVFVPYYEADEALDAALVA